MWSTILFLLIPAIIKLGVVSFSVVVTYCLWALDESGSVDYNNTIVICLHVCMTWDGKRSASMNLTHFVVVVFLGIQLPYLPMGIIVHLSAEWIVVGRYVCHMVLDIWQKRCSILCNGHVHRTLSKISQWYGCVWCSTYNNLPDFFQLIFSMFKWNSVFESLQRFHHETLEAF